VDWLDWSLLGWFLATALVVVGVAGTFLPAMPGPTVVFAGLLLAAWIGDFARVGLAGLSVLAVLTVLTFLVDFAASAFGAKRLGASPRAAVGAALGAVVGIFFGIPGLVLGPFVGAVIAEYTVRRDLTQAGRAGVGAALGIAIGAAAKLALVVSMLGVFALAYFT